jgi:hypothetical protein|tara:strand:- start:138 stop:815 length:678 start_codon:yes stop_codon:yes gene_type:complete
MATLDSLFGSDYSVNANAQDINVISGINVTKGNVTGITTRVNTKVGYSNLITYGANGLQAGQSSTGALTTTNGGQVSSPTSDWWNHIIQNHPNSSGFYSQLSWGFQKDQIHFKRVKNGTDSGFINVPTVKTIYDNTASVDISGTNSSTILIRFTPNASAVAVGTPTFIGQSFEIHNVRDNSGTVTINSTAAMYIPDGGLAFQHTITGPGKVTFVSFNGTHWMMAR